MMSIRPCPPVLQPFDYDAVTWIGDDPRQTPPSPPDAAQPMYPLEDVLAEFSAELETRLAARGPSIAR